MDTETTVIYYQLRARTSLPRANEHRRDFVLRPDLPVKNFCPTAFCAIRSILVDAAEWEWKGRKWCHMVSTTSLEDLHNFAALLGLERNWFQDEPGFPHYDLTSAKRRHALNLGARPVSGFTLVAHTYSERWPSNQLRVNRGKMKEKYPLNC
jgi:hypothetical protein